MPNSNITKITENHHRKSPKNKKKKRNLRNCRKSSENLNKILIKRRKTHTNLPKTQKIWNRRKTIQLVSLQTAPCEWRTAQAITLNGFIEFYVGN